MWQFSTLSLLLSIFLEWKLKFLKAYRFFHLLVTKAQGASAHHTFAFITLIITRFIVYNSQSLSFPENERVTSVGGNETFKGKRWLSASQRSNF